MGFASTFSISVPTSVAAKNTRSSSSRRRRRSTTTTQSFTSSASSASLLHCSSSSSSSSFSAIYAVNSLTSNDYLSMGVSHHMHARWAIIGDGELRSDKSYRATCRLARSRSYL